MTDNPRAPSPFGSYTGCSYCDAIPGIYECICDDDGRPACAHETVTLVSIEPDEHGTYTAKARCDHCYCVATFEGCIPTRHDVTMEAPGVEVTECSWSEQDGKHSDVCSANIPGAACDCLHPELIAALKGETEECPRCGSTVPADVGDLVACAACVSAETGETT